MGVVAGETVGSGERLVVMRLSEVGILSIMTVKTQRGCVLGQVIIEFAFARATGFVRDVACVAASIQGGMPAAVFRNVHAYPMTRKTQILVFVCSGFSLQQLVLVVRSMGVVAPETVADGRGMNTSTNLSRVFVAMALETELYGGRRDQLDVRGSLGGADLVAAQTAGGDGRVDRFALRFVCMALDAFGGIGIPVQGDRMLLG